MINMIATLVLLVAFWNIVKGKFKDAGILVLCSCVLLAVMNDISLLYLAGNSVVALAKELLKGGIK